MPTHPNTQARLARRKIKALHRDLGSWKLVAQKLGQGGKPINRGILSGVANGKRQPTPQLMKALGLKVIVYKPGRVCPIHGIVHDRICRAEKKTRPADPAKGGAGAKPRTNWKLEYVRLLVLMTSGVRL